MRIDYKTNFFYSEKRGIYTKRDEGYFFYSISVFNEKLVLKKIISIRCKSFTHCSYIFGSIKIVLLLLPSKATTMSTAKKDYKRITTKSLIEMKANGEKISMLTAYDYTMAKIEYCGY
jgi:hypothetical protein